MRPRVGLENRHVNGRPLALDVCRSVAGSGNGVLEALGIRNCSKRNLLHEILPSTKIRFIAKHLQQDAGPQCVTFRTQRIDSVALKASQEVRSIAHCSWRKKKSPGKSVVSDPSIWRLFSEFPSMSLKVLAPGVTPGCIRD